MVILLGSAAASSARLSPPAGPSMVSKLGGAVSRVNRWPLAVAVLAVAALALLLVVIVREEPDRTVTGTITEQQSHRVCVAGGTSPAVCVDADSPQRLTDFAVGDCVRLRYSAEELLISLDRVTEACGSP